MRVSAPSLDAADGFSAKGFSATLRLNKGKLDLIDMAMKIAGGATSGSVTFQRNSDSATLSGTMSAEQLVINRAGFSGRIGGTLEFASTGKSPAALIAGLAGGGQSNLSGVEFARSDPVASIASWSDRRRLRLSWTKPTSPMNSDRSSTRGR